MRHALAAQPLGHGVGDGPADDVEAGVDLGVQPRSVASPAAVATGFPDSVPAW